MIPTLRVDAAGAGTLIQDLGRPGYARLGVTASGAWDRAELTLANRLAGNPEDAAGLECLLGGLTLTALADTVVVVTGAEASVAVDGRAASSHVPIALPAGAQLRVGTPTRGLRSYVAVRGGLEGRRVFGSLSSNPTAGIGPAALASGDVLNAGLAAGLLPGTDVAASRSGLRDPVVLRVLLGPRDDWFTPSAPAMLAEAAWTVSHATDRVGTRLVGPALTRARQGELASEPLVRGAVQVASSGEPIVFGPDHPTTGGYPVIACVVGTDADALAQAAPGTGVTFEVLRRAW